MAGFPLYTGAGTHEGIRGWEMSGSSRACAGMGQGNVPPDPWMEYRTRQQQQQGGQGLQQTFCGATGHWVNRAQSVPVPASPTSGGNSVLHQGLNLGLTQAFPIGQNGMAGAGVHSGFNLGGCGFDPVHQVRVLMQGMSPWQLQSTFQSDGDAGDNSGGNGASGRGSGAQNQFPGTAPHASKQTPMGSANLGQNRKKNHRNGKTQPWKKTMERNTCFSEPKIQNLGQTRVKQGSKESNSPVEKKEVEQIWHNWQSSSCNDQSVQLCWKAVGELQAVRTWRISPEYDSRVGTVGLLSLVLKKHPPLNHPWFLVIDWKTYT